MTYASFYYTRIWDKFIDFKEFDKIVKGKTRLTCMNSLCTSLMTEREWFKSCFFALLSMEQRVPRHEVYNTSVSIETDSYYHIPNPGINCSANAVPWYSCILLMYSPESSTKLWIFWGEWYPFISVATDPKWNRNLK